MFRIYQVWLLTTKVPTRDVRCLFVTIKSTFDTTWCCQWKFLFTTRSYRYTEMHKISWPFRFSDWHELKKVVVGKLISHETHSQKPIHWKVYSEEAKYNLFCVCVIFCLVLRLHGLQDLWCFCLQHLILKVNKMRAEEKKYELDKYAREIRSQVSSQQRARNWDQEHTCSIVSSWTFGNMNRTLFGTKLTNYLFLWQTTNSSVDQTAIPKKLFLQPVSTGRNKTTG